MEQLILMLGTTSYKFSDGNSESSGASIYYVNSRPLGNLVADKKGYLPAKQAVAYDFVEDLKVPGIYNATFEFVSNSKGKQEVVISSLAFVKDADLSILFNNANKEGK